MASRHRRGPGLRRVAGRDAGAEDLGYDAVWLAELHFQKERSVLASPLVVGAAIAERTKRVKIGFAVQVLPLIHPLRLAEDVATVDHLSKGARFRRGPQRPAWALPPASTSRTTRARSGSTRRSRSS